MVIQPFFGDEGAGGNKNIFRLAFILIGASRLHKSSHCQPEAEKYSYLRLMRAAQYSKINSEYAL